MADTIKMEPEKVMTATLYAGTTLSCTAALFGSGSPSIVEPGGMAKAIKREPPSPYLRTGADMGIFLPSDSADWRTGAAISIFALLTLLPDI